MEKQSLPGTFLARKADGTIYYRATITHHNKHISLGSYVTQQTAHLAYKEAFRLLQSDLCIEQYTTDSPLLFEKWVCLINFRDNGLYIKNPIYLKPNYILYYFTKDEYYLFDADELFYFSEHKIMRRNGHLFVADYGMQIRVLSRYGVKNYARPGIDYCFLNQNCYDLRTENILIINPYAGVMKEEKKGRPSYLAKLHLNGNYIIGRYASEIEAAIAYNKAVDIVKKNGCRKNFEANFIDTLSPEQYASIYEKCMISAAIYKLSF